MIAIPVVWRFITGQGRQYGHEGVFQCVPVFAFAWRFRPCLNCPVCARIAAPISPGVTVSSLLQIVMQMNYKSISEKRQASSCSAVFRLSAKEEACPASKKVLGAAAGLQARRGGGF
jgi:hypothetical protein